MNAILMSDRPRLRQEPAKLFSIAKSKVSRSMGKARAIAHFAWISDVNFHPWERFNAFSLIHIARMGSCLAAYSGND